MQDQASEIRMEDGPVWDFAVSIRGVTLRLVSPLTMEVDLPLVPVPDQAELDRITQRRHGVFVRIWRWLFGDPPAVRADDLPRDGGAADARELCLHMYGAEHAEFLARLTTGEIFSLIKYYMGCQDRFQKALFDYGVECADKIYAARADREQIATQTAEDVHSVFAAAFGPPARRYAPGIVGEAGGGEASGTGHQASRPGHGDHTSNGAVKFPGKADHQ